MILTSLYVALVILAIRCSIPATIAKIGSAIAITIFPNRERESQYVLSLLILR